MKKYILAITILSILLLAGCTAVTVKENTVEVTVTKCEQGEFHPNQFYETMALKCLKDKQATLFAYYSALAEENGTYDYLISFECDGQIFTVIRNEEFYPGTTLTVTQIITYDGEQILKTEYK